MEKLETILKVLRRAQPCLTPPPVIRWGENTALELLAFDIDNASKTYKKILDFCPKRGSGVIMIREQHKLNNS